MFLIKMISLNFAACCQFTYCKIHVFYLLHLKICSSLPPPPKNSSTHTSQILHDLHFSATYKFFVIPIINV